MNRRTFLYSGRALALAWSLFWLVRGLFPPPGDAFPPPFATRLMLPGGMFLSAALFALYAPREGGWLLIIAGLLALVWFGPGSGLSLLMELPPVAAGGLLLFAAKKGRGTPAGDAGAGGQA